MGVFLVKRALSSLVTLAVVAVVSFTLIYLTPGDPVSLALGEEATEQDIARVRAQLGLDQPLPLQFARWFWRFATRLNLGVSLQYNEPVTSLMLERAESTLLLAAMSFFLAVCVGVPAGVAAATHHSLPRDQVVMTFATLGMSIPGFIFGLALILTFSVRLGWFPVAGYVRLEQGIFPSLAHILLPSVALGLSEAALVARMTRASMLEVLQQDYVRTARSKGLAERLVIYKHAMRNASVPIVTVIGLSVARLLGGAVVLEEVFALPGMGRLAVTAIRRRDYPIVQATVLLVGIIYMLVNLVVDILYAHLDPRVKYE
jgi:peptide/nickel transport system permease protein